MPQSTWLYSVAIFILVTINGAISRNTSSHASRQMQVRSFCLCCITSNGNMFTSRQVNLQQGCSLFICPCYYSLKSTVTQLFVQQLIRDDNKIIHQKSTLLILCEGNPPLTGHKKVVVTVTRNTCQCRDVIIPTIVIPKYRLSQYHVGWYPEPCITTAIWRCRIIMTS